MKASKMNGLYLWEPVYHILGLWQTLENPENKALN
jgi:hypothetical protein